MPRILIYKKTKQKSQTELQLLVLIHATEILIPKMLTTF